MLHFGIAQSKGLDEICSELPHFNEYCVSLMTMAVPFIFLLFVMVKCMLFFKSYIFYVWMFSQWMICIFALVIKHWNQINFQTLILLFISLLISELLVSQQLYWGMISVLYDATVLLRQARLNRKQTRFLFCISLMDILNVHKKSDFVLSLKVACTDLLWYLK